MAASFSAEMIKLVKRPAMWLLVVVWLTLSQVFSYLVPYVSYAGGGTGDSGDGAGEGGGPGVGGGSPQQILADALPANLVPNSTAGLPVFAGAIAIILGALVVGSEYGWGTLKSVLTQRPRRLSVYGGKIAALAVASLGLVLLTFGTGALSSWAIAVAEAEPAAWPRLADLAAGVGGGWLIATTWSLFGAFLAVLFRGVALPIGLGVVWPLGVENLVANIGAPLLDFVATLQKGLPGANAGSLVSALGAQEGDTPGVAAVVDGTQATITLIIYVLVFTAVAGLLMRRRDVS